MQEVVNRQGGYQVFKGQDGGTSIQGVWGTAHPFLDPQAVRTGIRDQVKQRLAEKIPGDLVEKRDRCRALVGACRADLNNATRARQEAVREVSRCWADICDLERIKAAEDAAAEADSRVNSVANRLRLAEGALAGVLQELRAVLDLALNEISAEPAPVSEAHLAAEAAVQKAFDKHASALAESAAIKFFWWSATKRDDGSRDGFADLAKQVLAGFEHAPGEPAEVVEAEPVAVVAE